MTLYMQLLTCFEALLQLQGAVRNRIGLPTTMHRCLCLRSPRKALTSFFGSLICFEEAASLGESCLTYSSCSRSSGRQLPCDTCCRWLSSASRLLPASSSITKDSIGTASCYAMRIVWLLQLQRGLCTSQQRDRKDTGDQAAQARPAASKTHDSCDSTNIAPHYQPAANEKKVRRSHCTGCRLV